MRSIEQVLDTVAIHKEPTIRVSIAGLADIRRAGDDQTQYGLLRNSHGIYTPVGGALAVPRLHDGLLRVGNLTVIPESREEPTDLRFNLPNKPAEIVSLLSWFTSRKGREGSDGVRRETYEELGPTEKGPLSTGDLDSITADDFSLTGMHVAVRPGYNQCSGGRTTLAISEIYRAKLSPPIMLKLGEIAADGADNAQFIFPSAEEILSGHSISGHPIGSVAISLLSPLPHQNFQELAAASLH